MEKNKQPAELQITSEQLLLQAYERKEEPLNKTKVRIADLEELHEHQRSQRKEYEDALRRNRLDFGQWMRYAQFEIEQNDMRRARSIFERALDINSHHVPLWIRYIDSELKTRNINHARNLFDRATTLLPRVDKLWFRYVQTEETLQNVVGTRSVFQRWMDWEPDTPAWDAYINFEKRYDEFEKVRKIFNQYVTVHPIAQTWLKWTKFEDEHGNQSSVREVFTVGIDVLQNEKLITSFAKWEASQREWERARAIYKFGITKFPDSIIINEQLTQFEKQFGDKDGIELSILSKRKRRYESELKEDPNDYDTWWSYLQLLEEYSVDVRRDAYENSVSNFPTSKEKVHWKRYVFLWIKYTIFEEKNGEPNKARDLFKRLTKILSNQSFTFSNIWILYSNFEIRQGDLTQARKVLGYAIGSVPKQKTFKHYISLEIKLKEFDRVRKIYEKYVESFPESIDPWIQFAELENGLNDIDRARGIYEIAIETIHNKKDLESLWAQYIEFEVEHKNYSNARGLHQRLLDIDTDSTTLWIKFAMFELQVPTAEQINEYEKKVEDSGDYELEFEYEINESSKVVAREVFEKALIHFKTKELKDERVIIYEAFKQFEEIHGDQESLASIDNRIPTVVKRIKSLDDGSKQEYLDYIFPDDKKKLKFLENVKKWKQNK